MDSFLTFRKMITPVIIQIIFILGVLATIIVGLVALMRGEILSAIVSILIGPIFVRVYCELLIVIFSINDRLAEIKEVLGDRTIQAD